MDVNPSPRPGAGRAAERRTRCAGRGTAGRPSLLAARSPLPAPLDLPDRLPLVRLRSATSHPFVYRRMIAEIDPAARPGDLVQVLDKRGETLGYGLFNPRSVIVVRLLQLGAPPPGPEFWRRRLGAAEALRRRLELDRQTDAYRLVHAEGDGLSGLVVDRYAGALSVETFSLGMYLRAEPLVPLLAAASGTTSYTIQMDQRAQRGEGFALPPITSPEMPRRVTIAEHGVRFRVYFESGHKTGFFCDQRPNRRRLAGLCAGCRVLDVCCYTGGFGIYARALGGAAEVTGVDLDEAAVAIARENANLNQVRIDLVHADAFGYMRQMAANGRRFEVVVLDPPKLIASREAFDEGYRRYLDLNRLALGLVAPGGLLLSCSCSGLLSAEAMEAMLRTAVRQAGRWAQVLDVTGAGPDHPVALNCPESRYLKAFWLRVDDF